MIRYREDERGRLLRWDDGFQEWFRILSDDDEYDVAARAVHEGGNGPGPDEPFSAPVHVLHLWSLPRQCRNAASRRTRRTEPFGRQRLAS
jgi:hypothetical protein